VAEPAGKIVSGEMLFDGIDLLKLSKDDMRKMGAVENFHHLPGAVDSLKSCAHHWTPDIGRVGIS